MYITPYTSTVHKMRTEVSTVRSIRAYPYICTYMSFLINVLNSTMP